MLALAVLFVFGPISTVFSAEKVRFATPVKVMPLFYLPVTAAEEKGFWKEQGLEVEWVPFEAGAAMHRAVAGGHTDMGMDGAALQVLGAAACVPVIMLADFQVRQNFYIWVRSDSRIREPKDLKGAKVGVTRMGSLTHAYGQVAAKALAIEDVRYIAAGGIPELTAGLRSGALDAIVLTIFEMTPRKLAGEARDVVHVERYLPSEWMDLVAFGRREFIEKNPEVTKRVVQGLLKGGDFVMKNNEWAVEKMKAISGYSPQVADSIYRTGVRFNRDGKIDKRSVENVRNFLVEYGLIAKEKAPPAERLYTGRFVE